MWSRCKDEDLAEMIFENLEEEEHGKTSGKGGHVSLNYRLLEALGWDGARCANDSPKMETWGLRHWIEIAMTSLSPVETIAVVSFTMERRNPEVLGRIYQGVKKNYKLSDYALEALEVHASHVEEEHGSLGPIAFERYANTIYWQDRVRFAVQHTAEMAYHMYNVWKYY
jgi:pyrroloquinoline quinone (PQQ) biosynthesis protein C